MEGHRRRARLRRTEQKSVARGVHIWDNTEEMPVKIGKPCRMQHRISSRFESAVRAFCVPAFYTALAVLWIVAGCARQAPSFVPPPFEQAVTKERDPKRLASLRLVETGKRELQNFRLERAAQEFTRAIEIDAANPYAYFYFAQTRIRGQRMAEAVDLLDQAVARFDRDAPWKSEALTLRGEVLESMKEYARAKVSFQDAVKVHAKNTRAKQGLARLASEE